MIWDARDLQTRQYILSMPRIVKRFIVLALDLLLCLLSVWFAFYLRLGDFISLTRSELWSTAALYATIISIIYALPIFTGFGLYKAIFRYNGWPAILTIGKATILYGLFYFATIAVIGVFDVPRTIGIIQPILFFLLVATSRILANFWLGGEYQRVLRSFDRPKVMIYGAGQTGRQLASAIRTAREMQVVGFVDDNNNLTGQILNGLRIYGAESLSQLVERLNVGVILLAMPNISRQRRNKILHQLQGVRVQVRTLPSVTHLAQGRVSITDLRDLDIDDLLAREPVAPDRTLLAKNIYGKVVLVTGAGGSIGSELCRQIMDINPSKLLLVEQSEYALYKIQQEIESKYAENKTPVIPVLASIKDDNRIRKIISTWKPDTVYHAAAYKHVPLVEHNPTEGIKNNVLGTLTVAKAAMENGVSDFVLVSTDKAVRPTNIMGVTKRLAEMVLQALAKESKKTIFTMVRFGNVLGSSGSVVPKFRDQIRAGGPITLTHKEITRYFMTIPEAAQLVIQAGAMAKGGDVFVLDMGNPIRIFDLARRMIELSGFTVRDSENPLGDIDIEVTGLRPGEKLYEELLIGEATEKTFHPAIFRAREDFMEWNQLESKLADLELALSTNDIHLIRSRLSELVPEYKAAPDIADWVSAELKSGSIEMAAS